MPVTDIKPVSSTQCLSIYICRISYVHEGIGPSSIFWIMGSLLGTISMKKLTLPFPEATKCQYLLKWSRLQDPLPCPQRDFFLSRLTLLRSCPHYYNCYRFICGTAMLSLENAVSLKSSTPSGSYSVSISSSMMIPKPWRGGYAIQMSHLELNTL